MSDQADSLSPPSGEAKAPKGALATVFMVVFIDLLGFGIVLPLVPRIAERYFAVIDVPEAMRGFWIGVMYTGFSAMQFIFAPIWGRLSDRYGRKPILMLGLGGSVVFYSVFGIALLLDPQTVAYLGIALIFLSRIGAGIAGATIATAQAVIADCTTPEKRSRGMALIGAAFGIGFTFGPLLAAGSLYFFPGEVAVPGFLAAGLSAIAFLFAWRKMPETLKPGDDSAKVVHRGWLDIAGLKRVLATPTVGLLVLTFFLTTFGFANFEGTLSILTKESFGFGNQNNFLTFAYVGFVLMVMQGWLYRKLAKTMDEVILMRIGLALMFLGLAQLAGVTAWQAGGDSAARLTAFFVALGFSVTGFAFLTPSVTSLISRRSDPTRQGEVLGVNQAFSALARILGPLVGMTVFYWESSHVLPYVIAAALLAVVMVLIPRIHARPKGAA